MTEHPAGERRAEDLDLERLGEILLRLPMTSSQLRHTSLRSSLDYIHAAGDLEMEYVRDVLMLSTREIIDRWFGGQDVATRAGAALMDSFLADLFLQAHRPS